MQWPIAAVRAGSDCMGPVRYRQASSILSRNSGSECLACRSAPWPMWVVPGTPNMLKRLGARTLNPSVASRYASIL